MPSSVPFSLIVPEEMDGREGTVRDFAARCSGIIMEAIKWAPETTRSLLQVGRMEVKKKKNWKKKKKTVQNFLSHPLAPHQEFQFCTKLNKI